MTDTQPPTTAPSSATANRLQAMLTRLWLQNEETLQQRLRAIRRAHEALLEGSTDLDEQTRIEARDAAHKLAGVLGSFGLTRGTDGAREAEVMLDQAGQFTGQLKGTNAARLGSLLGELETMLAAKSEELKQA